MAVYGVHATYGEQHIVVPGRPLRRLGRSHGTRHPVYVTGEIGINHNGARPVGHRA